MMDLIGFMRVCCNSPMAKRMLLGAMHGGSVINGMMKGMQASTSVGKTKEQEHTQDSHYYERRGAAF